IRDFHVTGVQTCALPISVPELRSERNPLPISRSAWRTGRDLSLHLLGRWDTAIWRSPWGRAAIGRLHSTEWQTQQISKTCKVLRSEERRVGKEWRRRGMT